MYSKSVARDLATAYRKLGQLDSARLGSVNEILAVYFMANKFGVPVCPHAGGVGLCELVQHLSIFDYAAKYQAGGAEERTGGRRGAASHSGSGAPGGQPGGGAA